jgi:predicted TIM-barrel fold metal-dependent hydrolase
MGSQKAPPAVADVNVWLGHWPFQRFRMESAAVLSRHLEAEGIGRALVSAPEAAFLPDCAEANAMLERRLKGSAKLLPVPVVNPALENWREVLRRGLDARAPAVRLLPGYHCYAIDDARSLTLLEEVARDGSRAVLVQMRMDDERAHHPLCKIPPVDCAALIQVARRLPGLSIVALCGYFAEAVRLLAETRNVSVDLAYVERLGTVASLLEASSSAHRAEERILFGSHTPFLYTRAAALKLEAADVTPAVRQAIASANARRLFGDGL